MLSQVGGPGHGQPRSFTADKSLSDEDVEAAIAVLKHSADEDTIREKMKATFNYRQVPSSVQVMKVNCAKLAVVIIHEKVLLPTLPLFTVTVQEHFHAYEVTKQKQGFVVFHVDNLHYPRPFDIQMSYGANDTALFVVPYCFI